MNNRADAPSALTRRLFALGVIGPVTAFSIGVDGGDIFQILAIDNLELDPRAIGTALGLGTLSIPIQIWAARIPLTRARHNIRIFLAIMAFMALATGALIAFAPPGSMVAGLALVIAVLAEIAVSVLFATSWQPLISYVLSRRQRQFINAQGRASTGIAIFFSVILFGYLNQTGRALFLVAVGLATLSLAWALRILPPPAQATVPSDSDAPDEVHNAEDIQSGSSNLLNVYLVLAAAALASWPLLITYARLVLWPTGNLGILGAAFALGSVVASGAWRDPGRRLVSVIRVSAVVLAACSVAVVLVGGPVESTPSVVVLLIIVLIGAAARSTVRVGVMELAHRKVTEANTVRVMTMFDVVGSTTFQVGFFVAGFLIAWSETSSATLDLYQWWLLATAALLIAAVVRLRDRSGPERLIIAEQ